MAVKRKSNMDSFELCVFNVSEEIEKYGDHKYEMGKEDSSYSHKQEIEDSYDDGYEAAKEEFQEQEPKQKELLNFAIEKIKEMKQRDISVDQLLIELESDYCTYL